MKWPRRYARRLFFSDLLVIAATLVLFRLIFVAPAPGVLINWTTGPRVTYWVALAIVGVIWMIALDAVDSRDEHVVGYGATEYDRVFRASLAALVLIMAFAFFFKIELARTLFLVAFPVGTVLLLLSRWVWRQWLRHVQRKGENVHKAIVIGEPKKAAHVIATLQSTPGTGMTILGAITEPATDELAGVQVYGPYRDLEAVVDRLRADTVIFAGADDLSPKVMRAIGWAMSDRAVDWIVAPAMTDVAGPRIHSRPMAGLPLVHVSFPRLDGSRRFLKRAFDLVGAGIMTLLLSPVLLGTALAVRLDSPGPILYHQERIGRNGKPFPMTKFRSMRVNADDELASLLAEQGNSDKPLHKITDDPRITRVGHFIRKYSLDELPQLFDVLRGTMSLVGPRPQREAEVALYDRMAARRLVVKPGMSGLWQVSGRSELDWDDALRLDLYYIENWSFMQDITILVRTVRAVVAPGGSAH